jgi:predicted transcriptional regulator
MAKTHVITVRVPDDIAEQLDAIRQKEQAARPGHTVARADVVRELVYRQLAAGAQGSQR